MPPGFLREGQPRKLGKARFDMESVASSDADPYLPERIRVPRPLCRAGYLLSPTVQLLSQAVTDLRFSRPVTRVAHLSPLCLCLRNNLTKKLLEIYNLIFTKDRGVHRLG